MATYSDLVEETLGYLRGFSSDQEQKTSLTVGIDSDDAAFTVDNGSVLTGGLIEIDDELIEVSTVDTSSNSATVFPWGRAQQGSTAASHSTGAKVTIAPKWPRSRVKRVVNEQILSTWPDLFAVKKDESNTATFAATAYPLPADCRRILDIKWEWQGPPTYWVGVKSWRLDTSADLTSFPTGVAVDIADPMSPGRTIKVIYAAEPVALVNASDDFATVSGLPESCVDLICVGSAARLVTATELARTQTFTVDHARAMQAQPAGSATSAARYLMALYQQRFEQERERLITRYPIRTWRTW
jgi:hypothetical protein